jgi:sucrose phosphorylase
VFSRYAEFLRVRREQPAFHPHGEQRVLSLHERLFAVSRHSLDGKDLVVCLVDVSGSPQTLAFDPANHGLPNAHTWQDLISGQVYELSKGKPRISLESYQVLWLKQGNRAV